MQEYKTGDRVRVVASGETLQLNGIAPEVAFLLPGHKGSVSVLSGSDYCRILFDNRRIHTCQDDLIFRFRDLRPVAPSVGGFAVGDTVRIKATPEQLRADYIFGRGAQGLHGAITSVMKVYPDGRLLLSCSSVWRFKPECLEHHTIAHNFQPGDTVKVDGTSGEWRIYKLGQRMAVLRADGDRRRIAKIEDLTFLRREPVHNFNPGDTVRRRGGCVLHTVKSVKGGFCLLEDGTQAPREVLEDASPTFVKYFGTTTGRATSLNGKDPFKPWEDTPTPKCVIEPKKLTHVELTPRMAAAQDLMHQIISIGEQCQRLQATLRTTSALAVARDGLKQIMADEIENQTKGKSNG